MKIIITGASGFIGSEIIPFLKKENVKVLLVGRNTTTLKEKFPDDEVAS
ncbi:MAG: NAD(P)-dependent oxidoreductase, partial [Planktomarina sp.]|nr:NAD(P)-dependent oxidoreductase [Planktomarina sp.]